MKFTLAILATLAVTAFAAGSCDDDADNTAFQAQHGAVVQQCSQQCATATDSTCIVNCVTSALDALKISAGCTSCVSGILTCFGSKCDAQCNQEATKYWNSDCFECGFTQCPDAIHACFANSTTTVKMIPEVIRYAAATVGACEDASDSPHLLTESAGCGLLCAFNSNPTTCVENCLENDTKFTTACRTCIANGVSCFNTNCNSQCTKGLTDSTCTACIESKCATAWDACMSTNAPARVLSENTVKMFPEFISYATETLGACEDSSDSPHLLTESAGCGLLCAFNSNPTTCVENCLENDTKFTTACRTCIANGVSCFNTNCNSECTKGLTDSTCTACIESKCATAWDACMSTNAPAKVLDKW